jgi:hypothetical protein
MKNSKYFIVPGFAKCGTTWLFDRLVELPDFKMPVNKELHYFNRIAKYNTNTKYKLGTHNYFLNRKRLLRNFGYTGIQFFWNYLKILNSNDKMYTSLFGEINKISGDITPIYGMSDKEGVQEMSKLLGDVNIIFILRDPIDRDWSEFRSKKLIGGKSLEDFNTEQIINYFKNPHIAGRGNYIEAIENFEQSFLGSEILISFYDDLKRNPWMFLEKIVGFLGGDVSHIKNCSYIQKRSNVSKKEEIPQKIYEYLKVKNQVLIKDLSCRYGGYCIDWYDLHYGESE